MKEFASYAKAFIIFMLLAGVSILLWHLPEYQDANVAMVIGFGILAGLTQVFKVEGATTKSSYNISLFIYGLSFFLLGPSSTMLVIIIAL